MTTIASERDTRLVTISTQVVQLDAEPAKGRQIEGPLALFWEPVGVQPEGQPRLALACVFTMCRMPSCPCREVRVRVTVVDDRISGVHTVGDGDIAIMYEPDSVESKPRPWGALTLDLDSGEVSLDAVGKGGSRWSRRISPSDKAAPVGDVAARISDLFKLNVDGELLQHLRRRWNALKGKTEDWRKLDWGWFEPGEMVGWHEAFPDAADGMIGVGDRALLPVDRYCVDPGCKCTSAMVEFLDIPEEIGDGPPDMWLVGSVEVKLSTGKAVKFRPEPGMAKLLKSAWKAHSDGAGLGALLRDRQCRMKEVGHELLCRRKKLLSVAAGAVAPKKKLRPNDPCACGSGKKYKKCCGALT